MKRQIFSERNTIIGIGLLFVLLALSLVACDRGKDAEPAPTSVPSDAGSTYQSTAGSITANGVLLPVRQVALSFGVGGRVELVEVVVGEEVMEGQALAALEATDLKRVVAQAGLDLESAQARLAQLQADPVPERLLAATAAITSAQAALTQAHIQAGMRKHYETIDRATLEDAEQAVEDAQREYQKVLNDPRKRDWAHDSPEAHALEEAQEYYEIVKAQYELRAADHGYAVAIANAEAQLAQAQLALYEAQYPVMAEEIALAQLDVEQAQLTLEAARMDLAHAVLHAPFDGVAAVVPVSVGEWVSPGTVAVELLDVSRWRVETKNVGELQIARMRVGQDVRVHVNAFRDETLNGRVVTISPVAVVQQGDTTYTLTIELEPTDLNLRPGMTVQVEIVVNQ